MAKINKDDILKTKPVANAIVKIIENRDNANIALFANWGQGKSTVLSFVENIIPKNYEIFTFDVWNYSGSDFRKMFLYKFGAAVNNIRLAKVDLFDANDSKKYYDWFFSNVTVTSPDVPKRNLFKIGVSLSILVGALGLIISGVIQKESAMYSTGSALLGVDVLASPFMLGKEYTNLGIESDAADSHEDFMLIFERIISQIKDKKYLVVFENIDRLEGKEVQNVLDSIKSFIDASENKISIIAPIDYRTIKNSYNENAHQTIDKIFTDTITIPYFDKNNISILLKNEIDALPKKSLLYQKMKGEKNVLPLSKMIFPIDPRALKIIIAKMNNILYFYKELNVYEDISLSELERHAVLEYLFPNIRIDLERDPNYLDVIKKMEVEGNSQYSKLQINALRKINIQSKKMVSNLNDFTTSDSSVSYMRDTVDAVETYDKDTLKEIEDDFTAFKEMYKKEGWEHLDETKANIINSIHYFKNVDWDDSYVVKLIKNGMMNPSWNVDYESLRKETGDKYLAEKLTLRTPVETFDKLNMIDGYLKNFPKGRVPNVRPTEECNLLDYLELRQEESASEMVEYLKLGGKPTKNSVVKAIGNLMYVEDGNYISTVISTLKKSVVKQDDIFRVCALIIDSLYARTVSTNLLSILRSNLPAVTRISLNDAKLVARYTKSSLHSYVDYLIQRINKEELLEFIRYVMDLKQYRDYHTYFKFQPYFTPEFLEGMTNEKIDELYTFVTHSKNETQIFDLFFKSEHFPELEISRMLNFMVKNKIKAKPAWMNEKQFNDIKNQIKETAIDAMNSA